jgi:hypothetical protein
MANIRSQYLDTHPARPVHVTIKFGGNSAETGLITGVKSTDCQYCIRKKIVVFVISPEEIRKTVEACHNVGARLSKLMSRE